MARLNGDAKAVLRDAGVSQAAWARANFYADGRWHGDKCTCPPSAVVDQIVHWTEVREGDLVLQDEDFVLAERVNVYQDTWTREAGEQFTRVDLYYRLDNGVLVSSEHHGDLYTAVRRYREG